MSVRSSTCRFRLVGGGQRDAEERDQHHGEELAGPGVRRDYLLGFRFRFQFRRLARRQPVHRGRSLLPADGGEASRLRLRALPVPALVRHHVDDDRVGGDVRTSPAHIVQHLLDVHDVHLLDPGPLDVGGQRLPGDARRPGHCRLWARTSGRRRDRARSHADARAEEGSLRWRPRNGAVTC